MRKVKSNNNKKIIKMLLNQKKMSELKRISVVRISFVKEMDNVNKLKMNLKDVNVIKDSFHLYVQV